MVPGEGSVLGDRYRLGKVIGVGGIGTVWEGHDTLLDRKVAIKEISLSGHLRDQQRAEVMRLAETEARIAAKLMHPSIVTVFDVISHGGAPWIVMQHVSGRSLEQLVTEDGPLPPDRVAAIAVPLLDALAAAHGAGWRLSFPLREHDQHGFFYCSAHCDDSRAEGEFAVALRQGGDTSRMSAPSGRRQAFWVRNCVAIGAAAATLDPLGATSIQLIYNAINRLISLFPHEDCVAELVTQFNRRTIAEYERSRDFAALHFWNSSRDDTPFWRERRAVRLPEPLEYRLNLFQQAGRLASFDDEIFTEADWVSVLLGKGIWPAHPDPLTLSMDVAGLASRTERMRQVIRQAAESMPIHQIYLEKLGNVSRRTAPGSTR